MVDLSGAAFGASNYMREILGYAPIEPDGSVRLEVPANVAFRLSVLDANGRRTVPVQGVWLQVKAGEIVSCNGCHTAGRPRRRQARTAARACSPRPGRARPAARPSRTPLATFTPNAGETMAEARMRVSCVNDSPPCAQMQPSVNVSYTDVWTDPAAATPGTPILYSYTDTNNPIPAVPTTALCATAWSASCRIIINYPQHLQPLWDCARRPDPAGAVASDHTCSQGGCHNPLDAAGAAQMPAGNLDLTKAASPDGAAGAGLVSAAAVPPQHRYS